MSENWVVLCKTDEVAAGEAKAFTIDDKRLCAVNDGESYFVLDDLCTHGQAFLSEGYCDIEECVLECPLHGGLVNYRDGSAAGDPVEKPTRSYAVRIDGNDVLVSLG